MSTPPRAYIIDRCDGTSYGDDPDVRKPPLPCCNVPPCVKWCQCLEVNPVLPCWAFGKVGCNKFAGNDSFESRRTVVSIGLFSNIVGMALTIFACFALTKDFEIIEASSFSSGTVQPLNSTEFSTVYIDIGLRYVAADNPNTYGKSVAGFDEFCDLMNEGLERYISEDACGDCEDASPMLDPSSPRPFSTCRRSSLISLACILHMT